MRSTKSGRLATMNSIRVTGIAGCVSKNFEEYLNNKAPNKLNTYIQAFNIARGNVDIRKSYMA